MIVKSAKTVLFVSLIAAMILPFSAMGFAEAEQVTEKTSVRNSIEAKMQEQVRKDQDETRQYASDEYGIPYGLIFEENGKLIVGLDAKKTTEFKEQYSESDVQSDIGTSLDIDVRYYAFERQANVRGGDALANNSNGTTITVVKNNKIITTGHAFSKNDIVNAGLVGGIACQEVKITKDKNFDGAYADASYGIDTRNSQCGNTYVNDSIHYKGKNYAVTYGTASDITKNKHIKIAGIKTTSSGYILDTDVTIRTPIESNGVGGVLHDQVIGSYSSTDGDSGAPIFEVTGSSSAKLLGQHVGRACEVDLNSGTNYGSWCDANSKGGLKFFSPWDQVATHLGI